MMARRLDKRSKIEELMRTITENIQNLINYHAMKSANPILFIKFREIVEEIALLILLLSINKINIQTFHNYNIDSSMQYNNINQDNNTINNFADIIDNSIFNLDKK